MTSTRVGVVSLLAALALGAAAFAGAGDWGADRADAHALAAQRQTIAQLQGEMAALRASDPDWAVIAANVEPSVVTVSTDDDLGSGWVAHADRSGSDIVTNFHVVASAIDNGTTSVVVAQLDRTMSGEIIRFDRLDDLALVHVSETLRSLVVAGARPKVGAPVMALGSPLGLSGSISVGNVAAFRSIFGADYLQFTAPISPGNSGGPVVDSGGRVVGIATAKLGVEGAESLGFAIPVQIPCAALVRCVQA